MDVQQLLPLFDKVFKGRQKKPTDCIRISNEAELLVFDDKLKGHCICKLFEEASEEERALSLTLINPNEREIAIWAFDGCFISSKITGKRCDLIFFDASDFCFAEFKMEVQSTSSLHNILAKRTDAIEQLKASFDILRNAFAERATSWPTMSYFAYVVTPAFFPSKDTSMADFAIDFWDETNAKLIEATSRIFK